ncbi:MAG: aspartate aminotransferase family protein [Coprobacillaceae bacterium]
MGYFERSKNAFLAAYGRYDITLDYGKGVYLYDINGKEYLDFYSGIGVNSFGYQYEPYVKNLQEQVNRLMHVSNYFNTKESVEAAEIIVEATKLSKAFLCNSGTEATEGALKLARKYYFTKHQKADSEIISLNHSFHGRSTGSVTLTGNPNYQETFGPLIEGVKYGNINDLESVKQLITPKTSAIIIEPIQGEGGVHVCTKEFLQGVRKLCDTHDIVLILDEVQCGMGRTGTIMTYMQYEIMPDIVCLAKGLGAGFPVGAFVANEKVANAMQPGDHGSTYGGNPLAGKAICSVFEILKQDNILKNVQDVSEYLIAALEKMVDEYDCIIERRGLGLMQALEFTMPVAPIIQKALDKGLIVVTAGANVVRMLPPLIITTNDVDKMITLLKEILTEI